MPLNALGWTTEEDENLVEYVKPHSYLYNVSDPSRKNILARESRWQEIAQKLSKPVEECKKRWRGLRDGYMRSKRVGTMHKTRVNMFEKLQFLDEVSVESEEPVMEIEDEVIPDDGNIGTEQQVITDSQEYYEITVVDRPQEQPSIQNFIKIMPKIEHIDVGTIQAEPLKKIGRKNAGRKKTVTIPKSITPIKILPKPIVMNSANCPKLVQYVDDQKQQEPRSQTIDKLIEKILKENTNEIDVFFRSMAASVKKLQPNLIPKVKMEVCNVIAKYEMQNYDKMNTC